MTEQRGEKPAPRVQGPASYFPSIEKRYGAPVQHWFDLLAQCPLERHGEQVAWLKTQYNLGHGHANALVAHHRSRQQDPAPG